MYPNNKVITNKVIDLSELFLWIILLVKHIQRSVESVTFRPFFNYDSDYNGLWEISVL